jgi:hypothetical protein
MCRLSWNLGASTSWNPQGLSRPVMGFALTFLPFKYTLCMPYKNTYIHILRWLSPVSVSWSYCLKVASATRTSSLPNCYTFITFHVITYLHYCTWILSCGLLYTYVALKSAVCRSFVRRLRNIFAHCLWGEMVLFECALVGLFFLLYFSGKELKVTSREESWFLKYVKR